MKTMSLYIFPGAPSLFYQQVNHNSYILLSLASALHYMGDEYASEYIITHKKKHFLEIQNKGWMHFCCDILMGHLKNYKKRLNYCIEECHTSTLHNIFRRQSTYPTLCLLLETWHRNDCCVTVCGKWIFDSNFEVSFPITQDCLSYTCCGNDTDEIKFFGVLYAIREVPPESFQRILNIK